MIDLGGRMSDQGAGERTIFIWFGVRLQADNRRGQGLFDSVTALAFALRKAAVFLLSTLDIRQVGDGLFIG